MRSSRIRLLFSGNCLRLATRFIWPRRRFVRRDCSRQTRSRSRRPSSRPRILPRVFSIARSPRRSAAWRRAAACRRTSRSEEVAPFVPLASSSSSGVDVRAFSCNSRNGIRQVRTLGLGDAQDLERALKAQMQRQGGKLRGEIVRHLVVRRRGFPGADESRPLVAGQTTQLAIVTSAGRADFGITMAAKGIDLVRPLDRPVLPINPQVHLTRREAGRGKKPLPIEIPVDEERSSGRAR